MRKSTFKKAISLTIMLLFVFTSLFNIIPVNQDIKADAAGAGKYIVGYYPEWGVYAAHNQYAPSDIPWTKVTHIKYAFATIVNNQIAMFDGWAATGITFGEAWDSPYKGTYGQFKKIKKSYPNVSVLISVGGWTQSGNFHSMAMTDATRTTFADSAVAFCREWGFDGVDIDWEWPGVARDPDKVDNQNDQGNPAGPEDKRNYTLLLAKLREKFDAAAAQDGKKYWVTTAQSCGYDKMEHVENDQYPKYLDFLDLMTYDMHGAWEKVTNHQAPLYYNPDGPAGEGNMKYNIDFSVKEHLKYGIPSTKINVGVPYYCRGWSGVEKGSNPALPGLFAPATGGAKGTWDGGVAAGNNPYYYIKTSMETNSAFKKYYDEKSGGVPYIYSESLKEMYTYEDEKSLQRKIDYVLQNNLGGIMFWEFTGDYPSKGATLTTQVYNALYGNYTPPPTTPPVTTKPPVSPSPTVDPNGYKVSGYIDADLAYTTEAAAAVKGGFKVEFAGKSAVTNANGYFEITGVSNGTTGTLKITRTNYLAREIKNVIVSGQNVTVSTASEPLKIWAGDIVVDNAINMSDIVEHIQYFNSAPGDGKYKADADFNKDNAINMTDILIIIQHFNTSSADYPQVVLPTAPPVTVTPPVSTNTPTPTTTTNPYKTWDPNETYTGGSQVVHNGHLWEAKWWTKGEEPGKSDVWKDLGPVGPAPTNTPTPTKDPTKPTDTPTPTNNGSNGYKVIGYLADWADWPTLAQNASKMTHINYAFANCEGGVVTRGVPEKMAELKRVKDQNPGLKTLISIGGWTWSKGFHEMALTDASRTKFADSAVDFMIKNGFDGVDIDWEYPGQAGDNNPYGPEDKRNFTLMLQKLREKLDARGAADGGKKYMLTIASGASNAYAQNTELNLIHQYLDNINIMTYDFSGGWVSTTAHHTNLYASTISSNWGVSVDYAVKLHKNNGVPAEKLVVGCAFYGRSFQNVSSPTNSGLGQSFSGSGEYNYPQIANLISSGQYIRAWDSAAKAPYAWSATKKELITYDDEESIGLKAQYVKDNKLGGAMFWEYTNDPACTLLNKLSSSLK